MAASPITSWQTEEEKVEAVTDFLFLDSKITADADCSHEIRRRLLLGRKSTTNLDSALKSKDITLPTKVCIVKSIVFPIVMYGMWELDHKEGWATKNWFYGTVVLEKTLENPLDIKEIKPVNPKGNQHWILIGRTDGRSNTLVIWCKQLTDWKRPWCWERLKAEEEDGRVWDGWIESSIQRTWSWTNSRKWSGTGRSGMLQSMGSQRIRHDLATEQQELLKSPTSKFSHTQR